MTSVKKHIVYTFLFVFLAYAFIGIGGLIGKFEIETEGVRWLFSLLIAQCATVIVAIIKAPEYFAEPEAIIQLTEKHQTEIFELNGKLENSLKDRENYISFISTKIMPDDPNHPFYNWLQEQKNSTENNI